jgi:hypothetical protein
MHSLNVSVNELLEYTGVYIVNDVFKYCAFYYHKIKI